MLFYHLFCIRSCVSTSCAKTNPIIILTLVGTAAKIIELRLTTGYNLNEIRERWKTAPAALRIVSGECRTIDGVPQSTELYLQCIAFNLDIF